MIRRWSKPAYLQPPKDTCEICGKSLYYIPRYKVRLFVKGFEESPIKELVVCKDCLEKIKRDKRLKKLFKIRYRKMRTLEHLFFVEW